MKKIGLTGGIGSGKTTVARIFEVLNIPIYNADNEAKIILNENEKVKEQIISFFGNIYINNVVDRKKLADNVFKNAQNLEKLNSIVHPAVREHFEIWCKKNEHYPYIIKEAAILFESNSHKLLDKIIMVYAPEKIRINRVCARDKVTKEEVVARIKNQMDDEKKKELSDFIVKNYDNHMLIPQVLSIHETIINKFL